MGLRIVVVIVASVLLLLQITVYRVYDCPEINI